MELVGWTVLVPLAAASLVTGVLIALGTPWGLFRHYWVLISLALTILCTVVLVLHMPTVSAMARLAQTVDGADLRALGGDLFHPAVGLLVLLAIAVLNVYKPTGVTPYGWRKQREQRNELQWNTRRARFSVAPRPAAGVDVQQASRFNAAATGVGYFTLHFAEMFVAMMLGMMVFVPIRLALTAQGYTALLDGSSIDFQAWMAAFMVAPMVAWMRVRGCTWRCSAEMSVAMLLPVSVVLGLRGLGLSDTLPWLSNSEHTAMLVGMLVFMVYRRDHYASGYSVASWRAAAARHRTSRAQLAGAAQPSAPAGMG